jgi:adenosine deaminase
LSLDTYIKEMPKVELHVHLEGSIPPETLLKLSQRNDVPLPVDGLDGLREWYRFTDFPHFIEIYYTLSRCICTPEDIELIAREFLTGQAKQNIRHSEVTYTAYTHYRNHGIPFESQLAALNRARAWAEVELNTSMTLTIDIDRDKPLEESLTVAEWAISGMGRGVSALGLGGPEVGNPAENFIEAFERAQAAGLPGVPHAGEVAGPQSIWDAVNSLNAVRIGHGVRCLEDKKLVAMLRERQIPLEVSPTSNVCLKVVPSFAEHPLPRLLEEGLYVTLNSDDPPMFNTTLTDEFLKSAQAFHLSDETLEQLSLNALRASFLPDEKKESLVKEFHSQFEELRRKHL